MAKGHTIPLTHLAHLLRRRQLATVTFFTTPGNAPFVRAALSGADGGVDVVELPFPDHATPTGVPPGAECVEALDSLSSFPSFVEAASLLQPRFEEALAATRPRASVVVVDAFLYWAHPAANALGARTLAFFGTSAFGHLIRDVFVRDNPAAALLGGTAVFAVPEFPDVQLSLADMPPPFDDPDLTAMASIREMDGKMRSAIASSHGLIVNTFDAMEHRYIEHWNGHIGPRAWPVGPLCLARPAPPVPQHDGGAAAWVRWLDEKAAAGRAVLYVALGTMAAVPEPQLRPEASRRRAGTVRAGLPMGGAPRGRRPRHGLRGSYRGERCGGARVGGPVHHPPPQRCEGVYQPLRVELGDREHQRRCAAGGVADGR
jgi:hypothetical protein